MKYFKELPNISQTTNQTLNTESEPKNRPVNRSDFIIEPYLKRSDARACWQMISTLGPISGLWLLISMLEQRSGLDVLRSFQLLIILALLVLLSCRSFALMHDCGHNSLFNCRWCNRLAGFLLGTLNAIPQHPWSRGHAYHHRHNGNWQLYRGPSALLSLREYHDLPRARKVIYSVSRNPIMLFPGGFFYLVIKPRLTLLLGSAEYFWSKCHEFSLAFHEEGLPSLFSFVPNLRRHQSNYWYTAGEFYDILANNLLVIAIWILMSRWLGPGFFWSYYSLVMTFSAAIFICIFFIQHNFNGSYAHGSNDWNYIRAAIEGSSNLDLPSWLNWFFADISFHSIHHLCERIPNYNLRRCHNRNKKLMASAKKLRITDIPDCFSYIIWDSDSHKLITVADADRLDIHS